MIKKKTNHKIIEKNKEVNERWLTRKPRKKPTHEQRMDYGLARNKEKKYEER